MNVLGFTWTSQGEIRWRELKSKGIKEFCLTSGSDKKIRVKECIYPIVQNVPRNQQWSVMNNGNIQAANGMGCISHANGNLGIEYSIVKLNNFVVWKISFHI